MATSLKLRRGTTAQHASFTGSAAEVTVDTDKNTVVVHNGSTAGGIPLAKETNPTINGNVTTTGLNFDSNTLVIDASGNNVGIGTSSPAAKLDVVGTLRLTNTANSSNYGLLSDLGGLYIQSLNSNPMYFATGGSERMRIDSSGNVGIGMTPSGSYKFEVSGNTSLGNTNFASQAYLQWGGNTNLSIQGNSVSQFLIVNTSGTERMRITSDGSVGIGTNSPNINSSGTVLHINNSTATRAAIIHMTNAESGSAATDGLICGKWSDGTNYFYDYDNNSIVFGTNNTNRMTILAGGNVQTQGQIDVGRINNTTSALNAISIIRFAGGGTQYGMQFIPTANDTVAIYFSNAAGGGVGSISTTSTNTSYVTSSDYRLKENVAPMTGALATVAQLKPVTYTWKSTGEDGQGFIAHELAEVVPDCVSGEKDAVDAEGNPRYQGIDTSFLVATLTAAIQELNAKVTALEAQLENK
jgi:hypothetical protein